MGKEGDKIAKGTGPEVLTASGKTLARALGQDALSDAEEQKARMMLGVGVDGKQPLEERQLPQDPDARARVTTTLRAIEERAIEVVSGKKPPLIH